MIFRLIYNIFKTFNELNRINKLKLEDYKNNYQFIFLEEEKHFNFPIERKINFVISETKNYYILSTFHCSLGSRIIYKGFSKIKKEDLKHLLEWSSNFDITCSFELALNYIAFKNIIKIER